MKKEYQKAEVKVYNLILESASPLLNSFGGEKSDDPVNGPDDPNYPGGSL